MKEKDHVQEVFSKSKEKYVSSSTHSNGSDLPLLIKWLSPEPNMTVLDIATGGGHVAKRLSPYVERVIAADLTKDMLQNTASHLSLYKNIDYIIADAENLPFLDHTFDIITCRIAAHHFPNPEKFISEVQRVLKYDGEFLLIDNIASENPLFSNFINKLEKERDYSHVRSLKISEWKKLLNENNLIITDNQERKKTLPFEEWINRTLDYEEDKVKISKFILNASNEIKNYFNIQIENNIIQSFTIDEWMVLCKKK